MISRETLETQTSQTHKLASGRQDITKAADFLVHQGISPSNANPPQILREVHMPDNFREILYGTTNVPGCSPHRFPEDVSEKVVVKLFDIRGTKAIILTAIGQIVAGFSAP